MSPQAPILAILLSCASSLAGITVISPITPETGFQNSFEPIVPWRGIRNTVSTPDFRLGIYQLRSSASGCGGIVEIEPFVFQNLPFRKASQSLTNANPGLGKTLWESKRANAGPQIQNKGIFRRIDGNAAIVTSTNQTRPKVGQTVRQATVLKTQASSTLDLFTGDNGPLLRLYENTELELTRLNLEDTESDRVVDTRLDLRAGRISGAVKKLSTQSTYLIRTRTNLIRIRGTEYEIDANGSCAIISGFAEVITPTQIITVNTGEKYTPSTLN